MKKTIYILVLIIVVLIIVYLFTKSNNDNIAPINNNPVTITNQDTNNQVPTPAPVSDTNNYPVSADPEGDLQSINKDINNL